MVWDGAEHSPQNMRYKMTPSATMADQEKPKNVPTEDHPPAPILKLRKNQARHFELLSRGSEKESPTPPVDDDSTLNFEMKPMRFENDSGIQHDSHVLVFASDMGKEARIYFLDKWSFAIFDSSNNKLSNVRKGSKPLWEDHNGMDEAVKQDLIEHGFCEESEGENALSQIKEKSQENQNLLTSKEILDFIPTHNLEASGRKFVMTRYKQDFGEVKNKSVIKIEFENPKFTWYRYYMNEKHHNFFRDENGTPILKPIVSKSMPWTEDKTRDKNLKEIFEMKGWRPKDIKNMLKVIEDQFLNNPDISANYGEPQLAEPQYTKGSDEEDEYFGLTDYEYAEIIMKNFDFMSNNGDEIYMHQSGVYKLDENGDQVDKMYKEMALTDYSLASSLSVRSQIIRANRTQPEDINPNPNFINFMNGLYDIRTGTLNPHTSDYKSTIRIPHLYVDDTGGSPAINAIIAGILQPEDIPTYKEINGYYMSLINDFKKNVFVVGDPDTGKTTLIDITRNTLGNKENCAIESLEKLSKNAFSTYNLKDKLLNADDDVNDKTIFNTDVIKQLTGGSELIRGEKKQQQAVLFRNTCKVMFGGNDLPPVFNDKAYIKRWILFECLNVHKKTDPNAMRKSELLATITERDYSLFIKECLDAFRGVLERGYFTLSKSNQNINRKYQMLSDPLKVFIDECTEPNGRELKSDFWKAYNAWAVKNETFEIANNALGRKMGDGKLGLGYKDERVNAGTLKISYLSDISLTDEAREEFVPKNKEAEQSDEDLTEPTIKVVNLSEEGGEESDKKAQEALENLKRSTIEVNPSDIKAAQAVKGM